MVFRAIGNATLQTAEKSGIAKNLVQPPYPCALPLPDVEDIRDRGNVEAILDFTFDSILDLLDDNLPKLNASVTDPKLNKPWKSVGYKDKAPGGDLVLQSRPHVGAYNFARALMTFRNVPPEIILHYMHSYELSVRRKYSDSISAFEVLCWSPALPTELLFDGVGNDKFHLPELAEMGIRDWHIEYNQYAAPPPVATRDMIYLVEKRYMPETQCYYIYGTSVDLHNHPLRENKKCVRGHVMFGWELRRQANGDTKARYVSCMNPGGWTPAFLVGFFKSAIGKELTESREMLYEILRQDAKLAVITPQKDTRMCDTIKKKPSANITINTCVPTDERRSPTVVTPIPSSDGARDDGGESSPFGARRSPHAGRSARMSAEIARRLSHYVDSDADTLRNDSVYSSTSGRDDSFSFSRATSSMQWADEEEKQRRDAAQHCEDVRLCDACEEEELCL